MIQTPPKLCPGQRYSLYAEETEKQMWRWAVGGHVTIYVSRGFVDLEGSIIRSEKKK